MVYIEWYTRFAKSADARHLMYALNKPPLAANCLPQGMVMPLSRIRQSCQLIPAFPDGPRGTVPEEWTSDNVLDKANKFYVNNWGGMYAYQTVW